MEFNKTGKGLTLINPSDTSNLPSAAGAIHVSVAGAIHLLDRDGEEHTVPNVPAGVWPIGAIKIFSTGTAATGLFAVTK
jgi:hypothetical protein